MSLESVEPKTLPDESPEDRETRLFFEFAKELEVRVNTIGGQMGKGVRDAQMITKNIYNDTRVNGDASLVTDEMITFEFEK